MAVDEALFLSASGPDGVATLRIYGFHTPTVSVGYRQRLEEAVDVARCRDLGVDCVKRPTGGRALLHQHELTYSVASPLNGVFRGLGVRAVYDSVSGAIRRALSGLGVALDSFESEGSHAPEPEMLVPCLALPGRHEIASGGRKIVASAQRRGRGAFLQHGSILRSVDSGLWARLEPRTGPRASLRAVGIDELMTKPVPHPILLQSLLESFQGFFGAPAERGELTVGERQAIPELRRKYRALSPLAQVDNVEAVW